MKKLVVLALSAALAVSICSCGNSSSTGESPSAPQESEAPAFNLSEYKEAAAAFQSETYQACIILGNVGNYEFTYWEALGRFDDNMVDRAFQWLSENSEETQETVAAKNEEIRSSYKELILTDFGDDTEAAETDNGIRALYDGYSALYNSVTQPSGSYSTFASNLYELLNEIESANDNLLLFLPDSE